MMLLTPHDANLFFELHRSLMLFVHQRGNVLGYEIASPDAFGHVSPEERCEVRDALLGDLGLIDAFVDENPFRMSDDQLAIVRSWQDMVAGKFYLYRELKKYTVFLSSAPEPIAYGVLGLTQSFEELTGPYRPLVVETALLPFKDTIIYDGLLSSPGPEITFGLGIRRMLNETYQQAKDCHGIVTTLPVGETPLALAAKSSAKRSSAPRKKSKPPAASADALSVIVAMTDQFCREHLNEEYADLCRKLAEMLSRERPSPLVGGKPNGWAAGIVRTIGLVNFLSDPSQTPHLKLATIGPAFGISDGTCQAKSTLIRKMLDINPMDVEWTLPSLMGDNPMAWLVEVDGLIVDIRSCPRVMQQAAFEEGLIPYIPADRGIKNP